MEERILILESYLKTMSYVHYKVFFFEKFGRQAPVKSVTAKMKRSEEHGETCR